MDSSALNVNKAPVADTCTYLPAVPLVINFTHAYRWTVKVMSVPGA